MSDFLSKLSPRTRDYILELRGQAANYRVQLRAAKVRIAELEAVLDV